MNIYCNSMLANQQNVYNKVGGGLGGSTIPLFKNDSNKIGRFIKGIECVTKSNVHFNWILQKSVAELTGRRQRVLSE